MRPLSSAIVVFWLGMPRPATPASRSSTVRARSGLLMSEDITSGSCATHRCAYSRPFASFQTMGPQVVQRTANGRDASPFTPMDSVKTSKAAGPSGVEVLRRIVRVWFDADEVAPIAAAVGEAPRHVAVAADDHGGKARQAEARDAQRVGRLHGIREGERGAVPDAPARRAPGACRSPPAPARTPCARRRPPSCCCRRSRPRRRHAQATEARRHGESHPPGLVGAA